MYLPILFFTPKITGYMGVMGSVHTVQIYIRWEISTIISMQTTLDNMGCGREQGWNNTKQGFYDILKALHLKSYGFVGRVNPSSAQIRLTQFLDWVLAGPIKSALLISHLYWLQQNDLCDSSSCDKNKAQELWTFVWLVWYCHCFSIWFKERKKDLVLYSLKCMAFHIFHTGRC